MSDAQRWPHQATAAGQGDVEPFTLAKPRTSRYRQPETEDDGPVAEIDLRQVLSRTRLLIILCLAVIVLVLFRLISWQIRPGRTAPVQVASAADYSRGRIVDSSGLLLATDNFRWEVYLRASNLKKTANRPLLLAELGVILAIPEHILRDDLATAEGNLLVIARDATDSQCRAIAGLKEPDTIWCAPRRIRVYPQGALAAHLIGFANMDQIGLTGVEGSYDTWLRMAERPPFQQMPGHAEPLPDAWEVYLPSAGGRDLVLHLNSALQYKMEQRLREAIAAYRAESGCIIVMAPHSGGILALANWPTYDPNRYGEAEQSVLRNAAVEFGYEPGSVFKLVTYAAALDAEIVTPDTVFSDTGKLDVEGKVIQNAEKRAYGKVTATQALARSINTVSARLALDLGGELFYRYVSLFGFGKPTEADVVYETQGEVRRWGTEAWNRRDQASNSFGQAILVTPLQMANAVATIANGGVALQPQIVSGVVKDGELHRLERRIMGQAIRPETATTLTRMMVTAVESYSVKNLVPGYRVAGKTGTAEIAAEGGYTSDLTITSFAGFLPAANPEIVILVKLDRPKTSKWAEQVALPVFQQVGQDAVKILKIEPDDRLP
jgi:cell division protein FtsI (penicillin-binding protein 3)